MGKSIHQKIIFFIQLLSLLFIAVFVCFNRISDFKYFDESYYIKNLSLLKQHGLSDRFFRELAGPAGPTHTFIHYIFSPLTNGTIPGIRIVNLFLLAGIIIFTWQLLRTWNEKHPLSGSLIYLLIPVTFVCCSLALTELPAMFFLLLSMLLLIKGSAQRKIPAKTVFLVGAALSMSLAVLGRQPYLLVIPVLLSLNFLLYDHPFRSTYVVSFAILSLLFPVYVFSIWEGWIPEGLTDYVDDGYSIKHAMIALGLCAVLILLLAPRWYAALSQQWKLVTAFCIAVILLNFLFSAISILPFRGFFMRFDHSLQSTISLLAGGLLVSGGLVFLLSMLGQLWRNRNDFWFLFAGLCLIAILISCLKVTHMFSARYVYQAAPFIVFLVNRYREYNLYTVATTITCMLMGIAAMWFTFH
jgi:hypothetical protein